jgi:hypothetical protein
MADPTSSKLDPVRAALEEAKSRPMPPPEERERLMAMAREAMKYPRMSLEDFEAMVAERRAADAAE